ncbi:MAG: DUF5702 domain-containing protein [Lachnospiraceae bacterium]|nr:DUF5702 domain-containing protein [Lachnospiraceae bacterium]
MKIFYNKHGSLTVFMSLILTIVMIFTTVLIDGGRIILARNIVSGAGDMALNAGLTYYNSVLQDTYGLFAISKNMTELHDNLEVYFEATLKSSGLHDQGLVKELVDIALSGSGSDEISDIMKMKLADGGFEVSQAAGANLSNANILRAQVLDYMKYRAPAVIGYGFLEKMNILKSLPAQQKALEDKKDYEKKLKEIQDLCLRIYKKSRDYEDYLTDPNGYFKTPQEIKHDIYYWGDENFKYSTQDAVAYVQVEKLPELGSEEVWTYNNHDPSGADLEYYVNNFENIIIKTRSDFAGMEYYKSKDIPISNSETKAFLESSRFTRYIIYYNRYKEDVAEFHKVNASYETSKLDHEQKIIDLENEKKRLPEDDKGGRRSVQEKINIENNRWRKLENWYNKDFLGSEPLDNYSEDLLVKKPYGPSYDLNLLRDRYLSNIKQDIKLLATPQMRTARDYYLWFDELNKKAVDIKSELVKLKSASEQLQNIADNWNVDIGNMAESGVKNDMHQDYATKTKAVIEGYVDEMIKIFQRSIDYSSKVTANLKEFKYAGITPATDAGSDDQWVDGIISYVSNLTNQDSLKWNEEVISKQEALHTLGAYIPTEDSNLLFLNFENNIPEKIKRVVETKENAKGYKLVDSEFDYKDPKLRNFLGVECYDAGSKYYVDPLFAFLERNSSATKPEGDADAKKKRKEMINGTYVDNKPEPVEISDVNISDVMASNAQAAQIMDGATAEDLQSSDENNLADNALEASGKAISGFDRIGEILTGGRDKLYLMAYTTTMFSCYTTNREAGGNKAEKTLSGVPFSEKNNEAYRAEQEYILLGDPKLKNNVEGVKTRIFGVRFLLNAIYAYTSDSALKTEALTMAMTIAGATGFLVPIVQNILLLAAALTESVFDVNDLVDGKSVPLYKNPQAWRTRFERIGQVVAEGAASTLYKKMNEYTDEAKNSFNDTLDKYVSEIVDTSTESIIASIQAPIQEKLVWCMTQVGDARDGLEDRLKNSIKECFDKMQADMEAEVATGGLVAKAKLEAFKSINNSGSQDRLVEIVMQTLNVSKDNINDTTKKLNDNIDDFFKDRKRNLEIRINSILDKSKLQDKLKKSVGNALDAANSSAQEAINNKINEFNKEFEGAGGDAVTIGEGKDKLELNGFDKTKASTFNMSYKDYLMVFLAIQYLIDEKGVICRMGNIIQTNASKEGSLYYAGDDFSMQNASVLLQVKAEAQIQPVFLQIPKVNNNNEKFIVDGKFGYPIDYKGVLGY